MLFLSYFLYSIRTSASSQMGKLTLSSSDTVYLKDDNDAKSAGKSCSMHVVCVGACVCGVDLS